VKEYLVLWTEPAHEDLFEIIEYISVENKSNALKILKRIEDRVNQLNIFPNLGRVIPELEPFNILTYKEIIETPRRIIYKIANEKIYIISVLDGRRNVDELLIKIILK
jgi:plasmid stabilization system protein ParE